MICPLLFIHWAFQTSQLRRSLSKCNVNTEVKCTTRAVASFASYLVHHIFRSLINLQFNMWILSPVHIPLLLDNTTLLCKLITYVFIYSRTAGEILTPLTTYTTQQWRGYVLVPQFCFVDAKSVYGVKPGNEIPAVLEQIRNSCDLSAI